MFGIGETELVIIVVFAFLLFGPDKLPGMGRTLGRVLRQFREASDGFTEVVQTNIMDPASEELEKSPKQRKREAAADKGGNNEAGTATATGDEPRRETFAERKARLLAERKAAEDAASKASDAEASHEASVVADSTVPGDDPSVDVTEDGATKGSEDAPNKEPARTSAADLYALTTQRSSRSEAKKAASQESVNSNSGEEDGDA